MAIRKSKSKKAAVKKCDKYFSLYIRLDAADIYGMCKCVSCGQRLPIKEIQAGHYHIRKMHSVRWDKRNAHPQCAVCNGHEEIFAYSKYMFEHYTVEELDKLNRLAHTTVKFSIAYLDELSNCFLEKIKILQKRKGLQVL